MPGVLHRILMAVPAAKQAAVQAWVNNNLDQGQGSNWFVVGLSANGQAPATYYADCFGLTTPLALVLFRKLCQMAGIVPPADFDTYTKAQIISWLQAQVSAIKANTGIWLARRDNDGIWDNFLTDLAAQGLQVI